MPEDVDRAPLSEAQLKALFEAHDIDKDGFINKDELWVLMSQYDSDVTAEDVNGVLDYQEFLSFMKILIEA
ncbi:hypothetical protein BGZ94_008985 [Podila epigama]|nr:hypothetical protein BGZ94_008985 [Podila epigama]